MSAARSGIVSVGYEGRALDEFVRDLSGRGVAVLADVRLNAVSRRHGFSKTALRTALEGAGIGYVHLRALGNPRANRAAFAGPDLETGRLIYRRLLDTEAAQHDLATLRALVDESTVAILCVERDDTRCHRRVLIDAL